LRVLESSFVTRVKTADHISTLEQRKKKGYRIWYLVVFPVYMHHL